MASNNLTCVEPGATVTCDEDNMTISLKKETFPFFDANNLHLRYSSCRATQNSTHVSISTNLNACGTLVNETEDALIFWNEIRVDAVITGNVITRTHDINLRFHCSYSRKKMLSVQFQTQQVFIGSEAGYGNFTFRMDFYRTAAFATPYTENDYPISIPSNEFLYVKYSVESSADLVIMAENCKATRYGNFYSLPQYTVIQNGCPRDTTMEYTYYPTASSQQFRMRSFKFFNDYYVVYFHCELLACYRYNYNSRCSRGCLTSKKRKRREIDDKLEHDESTNKYILTSGPIKIAEISREGGTGQGQNIAFIVGAAAGGGLALIAIIALAVLAVKYRLARKFMNRNKVEHFYTGKDEQMSRRNAFIQEDDMIEKKDSF
ncbi:ZP domain-containing protein-like [Porites lutea]|uniref:ZP domain-containing protein-like n=1 Tax=Porites lutea TaxID=51062 RepID=UPI003CC6A0B6